MRIAVSQYIPSVVSYSNEGTTAVSHEDGRPRRLHSSHRAPRMPSDGTCGCTRSRDADGWWLLELCDRHAAEPGIVDYCLV